MSSNQELALQIGKLIERDMPGTSNATVESLAPLFGGNARKAWSFDLGYTREGATRKLPCVMLSQVGGRQVESDVAREFHVLQGLNATGARVPKALAVDSNGALVGSPSIVMERLPGKANAVDFLKSTDASSNRLLTEDLAQVVAELHDVRWDARTFDPTLEGLSPREVAALQVEHWFQIFEAKRMEPNPVMASLFEWLRRHLPDPQRICLVHGDLRPGNFLYEHGRVTGLLDWEMAHLGDPVEDLGWIYRPFWSPERFVSLREFVTLYGQLTSREVPWISVLYYRIFSEVKFATISLTAAHAFASASTTNLRHADRAATVGPCLRRCLDWIELHRLEESHA